jgi:SAM-dependent methyltransferase
MLDSQSFVTMGCPTMPEAQASLSGEFWDLEDLARSRRLCDWMFEQFSWAAKGVCAEVGPGIGTFSDRLLGAGVESLLLLEPASACTDILEKRFAGNPRVRIRRERLPEARTLLEESGNFDFVLCQNVLEHIREQARAVQVMGGALRPGGRLTILVPANPALFGPLDRQYGHMRRYTKAALRQVLEQAGLRVTHLYAFNTLGIVGWWMKNQTHATSLGRYSLAMYETLLPLWRPFERRLRIPWGLSLVAHAERA